MSFAPVRRDRSKSAKQKLNILQARLYQGDSKADLQKWVLNNVGYLAKHYKVHGRSKTPSLQRKKQRVSDLQPSSKYKKIKSKVAQNLKSQERAAELNILADALSQQSKPDGPLSVVYLANNSLLNHKSEYIAGKPHKAPRKPSPIDAQIKKYTSEIEQRQREFEQLQKNIEIERRFTIQNQMISPMQIKPKKDHSKMSERQDSTKSIQKSSGKLKAENSKENFRKDSGKHIAILPLTRPFSENQMLSPKYSDIENLSEYEKKYSIATSIKRRSSQNVTVQDYSTIMEEQPKNYIIPSLDVTPYRKSVVKRQPPRSAVSKNRKYFYIAPEILNKIEPIHPKCPVNVPKIKTSELEVLKQPISQSSEYKYVNRKLEDASRSLQQEFNYLLTQSYQKENKKRKRSDSARQERRAERILKRIDRFEQQSPTGRLIQNKNQNVQQKLFMQKADFIGKRGKYINSASKKTERK